MEKLELKHLSCYLPYGLTAYGSSGIWTILAVSQKKITMKNGLHTITVGIDSFSVDYDLCLRPLSDLTKEIEVNGEKFIPIHKLYEYCFDTKILDFEQVYVRYWDTENALSHDSCYYCYCEVNKEKLEVGPTFIPTTWKRIDGKYQSKMDRVGYDYYQMLFEWHFDVFNLIEKGLAIDINTINTLEN